MRLILCDLLIDHRTDFPFFTSLIVSPPWKEWCRYPCSSWFPLDRWAQALPRKFQSISILKEGTDPSSEILVTQPECTSSDLTRPQSPRSLTKGLSKDTVGGKARNMEKCVFPSWTASEAAHHNCTIKYKLKKYQRIAEVPSLWSGRDLNLCFPISRGCLLVRAKLFHGD